VAATSLSRAQVATPSRAKERERERERAEKSPLPPLRQIARCDEKLTSKAFHDYSSSFFTPFHSALAFFRASHCVLLTSPLFPPPSPCRPPFFHSAPYSPVSPLFYRYRAICHFVSFFIHLSRCIFFPFSVPSSHASPGPFPFLPFPAHSLSLHFIFRHSLICFCLFCSV